MDAISVIIAVTEATIKLLILSITKFLIVIGSVCLFVT